MSVSDIYDNIFVKITQLTFTCPTSAIETLKKGVKYIQN